MSELVTLGVVLTLMDRLSGPLGGVLGQVQRTAQRLTAVGTGALYAGETMAGSMRKPIEAFSEAEDAATRLRTVMMDPAGQVGEAFGQINALAGELGNKLPGTTADFQNMMTTLKEQGVSNEAILSGLGKSAAYLGVALKMPYEQAAQFAARLSEATGVAEGDMMSFLDTIARTRNLGVQTDEMGYAFARSAGKLKEMGIQGLGAANAMAPLYALLIKGGLSGETTGTGFASILSGIQAFTYGLTKPASFAKATLEKLGISLSFLDEQGKLKGPEQLIAQLEKLKALSGEKRAEVLRDMFGTGQDAQMVATLIDNGVAGYRDMVARMGNQADLNMKVNEQLGTLKNLWDAATGTFTNALAAFAGTAQQDIKAVVEWLGQLSERLGAFVAANPELSRMVANFALFGGAATVGFGALSLGLGTVLRVIAPLGGAIASMVGWVSGLSGAFSAAAAGASGLFGLLAANPVGLFVVALGAAALAVYRWWEPIKGFFSGFWAGLTEGLGPVLPAFQAAFGAIGAVLAPVWGWIQQLITPIQDVGGAAESMGRRWGAAVAEMIGTLTNLVGEAFNLGARLYEAGLAAAQGLANGLMAGVTAVWEGAKTLAGKAVSAVTGALKVESPSRVMMGIGGQVAEGLRLGLAGGEAGVLGQMAGMARGLTAPLAGMGSGLWDGLAGAGRQLAAPLAGATLGLGAMTAQAMPAAAPMLPALAGATAAAPAAGGAPQVTLNLTVNGPANPDELSERIGRELDQWWRRTQADEALRRNGRGFD